MANVKWSAALALVLIAGLGAASGGCSQYTPNAPVGAVGGQCVECHTDSSLLNSLSPDGPATGLDSPIVARAGEVATADSWRAVYLDQETDFVHDVHRAVGCVICHEGNSSAGQMTLAHEGLVGDPSGPACQACHSDAVEAERLSLHSTLSGFETALTARGGDLRQGSALALAVERNCKVCHTTCGGCHVSRPDAFDGGLAAEHDFLSGPELTQNCLTCHGATVGEEYFGLAEGAQPDIHKEMGMECADCHKSAIHSSGEVASHRYDNPAGASCEDCHERVMGREGENAYHQLHEGILSCQVCHSMQYKNCYGCHLEPSEEGSTTAELDSVETGFEVARNPLKSEERPYGFVVVRHVPVAPGTFEAYGDNLLPDFDSSPTWTYSTPHNIRLHTPQSDGCNYCHGQEQIFLVTDDIAPDEAKANESVVVEEIPGT